MSDQNFNLPNQDGVSVGHIFMSFQEKKKLQPCLHIANCER